MRFAEVATYLDRMEATRSRNELVKTLAELYAETSPDEIQPVTYLIQGRLVPFFEPVEIGMGEKLVIASIAQASTRPSAEVSALFNTLGDLGLVAERLSTGATAKTPSITEAHSRLMEIAASVGPGSVERKRTLFASLLSDLDARSAKHLVRMALGRLRLGIGDPTVLEALSFAKMGDRSLRPALEAAYNRTSDLGLIAKTFWTEGEDGIGALKITVGRPIRPQLAERLPNPEAVIKKLGSVVVQPKYDGIRVQIHKDGSHVRVFSRNLEDFSLMFVELVAAAKKLNDRTLILDGEAIGYNPESEEYLMFQQTASRRRQHGIEEAAASLPLVDNISKGLEGVVVKRMDSPYQAGARNFNWVKLKRTSSGQLNDTVDLVLLGYYFGRGKRTEFGLGALLAGVYDSQHDRFDTITKIGTGLSDAGWREIHQRADKLQVKERPARVRSLLTPDVWLKPEVVVEVLADEITPGTNHTAGKVGDGPGYALRFPRIVSFRGADKRPEDATTVKEIVEMFQQQGRRKVST